MDPLTSPHREGSVPVGPGVFFDMIVKLGNLKNYIESVHAKAKCPCNLCECKATSQGILKTHNESVHENVQYCLHSHHTRKDSTNFHLHFNFIVSAVLPRRGCNQIEPSVLGNFFWGTLYLTMGLIVLHIPISVPTSG